MLRKLIYKGKKEFLVLYPHDILVSNGTEVTVNTKEEAELFKELGFTEVAEGKKQIEKKKESE